MISLSETEKLVCAVLRGESPPWEGKNDSQTIADFIFAGRFHGILPLLDLALNDQEKLESWPESIREACKQATLAQAMYELAHRAELIRVLEYLESAGITPLIIKGTSLAYGHYPNPALRPRADTDLLVPFSRRHEVELLLNQFGYRKGGGMEGSFISYQSQWTGLDSIATTCSLDIHWRINNSQLLAKVLIYDELLARAEPLPALGAAARALTPVDALLLSCIHRAGHANAPYYVDGVACLGERLIWLYDIHLLISRMSVAEVESFAELAVSKRIAAICLDALIRTSECFGTPIPSHIVKSLGSRKTSEPSARYLSGGRARQMLGDFISLDDWGDRCRWLSELAFPPSDYMRKKYSDSANLWLPILYARRGLSGLGRLILRRRTGVSSSNSTRREC